MIFRLIGMRAALIASHVVAISRTAAQSRAPKQAFFANRFGKVLSTIDATTAQMDDRLKRRARDRLDRAIMYAYVYD